MSVIETYNQLVFQQVLKLDTDQGKAIIALDKLSQDLSFKQFQFSLFTSLKNFFIKPDVLCGIYFYGRVGRGKTMLMDLFYQQLTIVRKERIHFHHFMENVHQALHTLSGQANPLNLIAKRWAMKVDVLCFDEFFVNDIGDAMLLAGLLEAIFSYGITLVATSNCQPEQLYKNGLQRERFLPTIDIIKKYCQVISIDGPEDHRLIDLDLNVHHYRDFNIITKSESNFLSHHFLRLAKPEVKYNQKITVNGRDINYLALSENIIWFEFLALCSGPRSQRDYIKLADDFSAVLLSNVPQFNGELIPAVFSGVEDSYQRSGVVMGQLRSLDDEARRFIALVDEFYDRGVRLIIEAEVDIEELYQGTQLNFEFARCKSRLYEMQKINYS